jgi:large subunit ribosomal protein L25
MEKITLKVQKRDLAVSAKSIRAEGMIPAICYGAGKDNVAVQMDYQDYKRTHIAAGENTVVELDIDGEKHNVLIHDMQIDPIYSTASHVDFLILDMKVKVDAYVPIVVIGETVAVKEQGGTLNTPLSELHVRCLPGNIPHEFTIDVSGITDFHTALHVSDLEIPADVEVLTEAELTIVNVSGPSGASDDEPELTPEELEKAAIAASAPAEGEAPANSEEKAD